MRSQLVWLWGAPSSPGTSPGAGSVLHQTFLVWQRPSWNMVSKKSVTVFLIKLITWMLGLIWFQAAYVPGLFSHEDLCQLQQAALELGRHLQTQDEGHNPQQFICQVHVALQWLLLTGRKMTWPDLTHNSYMDWFSSPNVRSCKEIPLFKLPTNLINSIS